MKIAIVGTGISGLTAAWLLSQKHDITVFEANDSIGGHTATKQVNVNGENFAIDTGFIVYNDWTYPNFIRILQQLGVESQPTEMGFSVFKRDNSFYYSGNNLSTLFAKRELLFKLSHWKTVKDILRFNKESVDFWKSGQLSPDLTLGQFLQEKNYSHGFIHHYLIPMGSAIWSSSCKDMLDFPSVFFVEFFYNHGLLSITDRPTWRVIKGGSKQYLGPITAPYKDRIHTGEPVIGVRRLQDGVHLSTTLADYTFDHVVMAQHSNQALKTLQDPSEAEQRVLGDIRYSDNHVTLHTDIRLLPPKSAWASWNYCLLDNPDALPLLTYNMNILQGIKSDTTFCVSLNARDEINPEYILGEYQYAHPIFDKASISAQKHWQSVFSSETSYCGAYWFNGFHEDGVNSAIRVARHLGVEF